MDRTRLPQPSEISDDTMFPLKLAAEVAQARGVHFGASVKSLRREADRGRLEIWEIFGRHHTSLGAIKRMIERCRVPSKACGPSLSTSAEPLDEAALSVAQDALNATLQEHMKPSRPTSKQGAGSK